MSIYKTLPAAIFAFAAVPGVVLAGDIYTPPAGCEAFLTVQSNTCEVNILWHCDIAPAGDKWDAYFDYGGLQSIVSYSGQYAWLDAEYFWDNSYEETIGTPLDPISLGMLVIEDRDSYDFEMRRTDDTGSRVLRVTGLDAFDGGEMTIDDQILKTVSYDYEITEEDGSIFYKSSGVQLFSPELQVFLSYLDTVDDNGAISTYETAPADFIFPGEPGFADPTPLYGCSTTDAETSPEPTPPTEPTGPIETGPGKNNDK
ncbi:MAG: hypothetical protein GY945_12720 [Rhodobacteraceae bacterium]|nr:hypothetical protein [Paracoccaceae bacterium]